MPTTTRLALRRSLAKRLGSTTVERTAWTTTTNITTNTSVISTELTDAGYNNDDYFIGWYILFLGTNNAAKVRRITDYTASSGTLTVSGTPLSGESGVTDFELHRYDPNRMMNILNEQSRTVFPLLHQPVVQRLYYAGSQQTRFPLPSTLIGRPESVWVGDQVLQVNDDDDNIIDNGNFETGSGAAFTGWTAASLTLAEESYSSIPHNYAVLRQQRSVQATVAASTVGTLLNTVSNPTNYDGMFINFSVWVYSTTASRITAQIIVDSSTASSSTHNGSGWEQLFVQTNIPKSISSALKVGLSVSSGVTMSFYVDEARAGAGPASWSGDDGYTGYTRIEGWRYEEGGTENTGSTSPAHAVILTRPVQVNTPIKIVGMQFLSQLSTESGTMEISEPQTELLYAYSAVELLQEMQATSTSASGNQWVERELIKWMRMRSDYKKQYSMLDGRSPNRNRPPDWTD